MEFQILHMSLFVIILQLKELLCCKKLMRYVLCLI